MNHIGILKIGVRQKVHKVYDLSSLLSQLEMSGTSPVMFALGVLKFKTNSSFESNTSKVQSVAVPNDNSGAE